MLATARSVSASIALAAVVAAQSYSWVQVSTTGPHPREAHGMAYDAARLRTVLFGGQLQGGIAGDTWEWNGVVWSQLTVASPTARRGLAMAYDSIRQRTLLFGGWDGAFRADTWEWNGTAWVPQILASGPSPRENHAMAYDSQRGRVVLFGGYRTSGGYVWHSDTWEWDGTAWNQANAAGPSGRAWHGMAYDSHRGRTVLFGGANSPTGTLTAFLGDTWEWDGATWAQVSTSGPPARAAHAMAYDATHQVVRVMGGNSAGVPGALGMWAWDGVHWGPSASSITREGAEMVYDSDRGRIVMFGGVPWQADTWELVTSGATATPFGAGCGTPALVLAGVPSAPPTIGNTAQAAISNAPTPIAFVALGVSNTTFGPFSLPVSLASVGMPGCSLLQSANVTGEPTTATGAGTASYTFAIPGNPALVGFHVYLQAWAWAPGANAANVIVSNGLDWSLDS